MRHLITAIFSMLLMGCGNSIDSQTKRQFEEMQPKWSTLNDGSKFALTRYSDGDQESAIRCWPQNDQQYLCLFARKSRDVMGHTSVFRLQHDGLPFLVVGHSGDGYGCYATTLMGDVEKVSSRGDVLISNRLRETNSAWSRSFVDNYIRENGVSGTPHFDCLNVLDLVQKGSLRTLGTTSLSADRVE